MQATLYLVVVLAVGAPATKENAKKDPPSIEGEWRVESMIDNGVPRPIRDGEISFTFTKDKNYIVVENAMKSPATTFRIDLKMTPHEIDLDFPGVPGLILHGIFKIEGDTLTLCTANPLAKLPRPTEFESAERSGRRLFVFKRAKKE